MSHKPDRWAAWMSEHRHGGDAEQQQSIAVALLTVRDRVLYHAQINAGETLLDVGTGDGLIALEALRRVGEQGKVIFSDVSQDLLTICQHQVLEMEASNRSQFLLAPADNLQQIEDESVDVVTTRSVLIFVKDKPRAFQEFYRVLAPNGRISIFEPVNQLSYPRHPNQFWNYDVTPVRHLGQKLFDLYERLQPTATDPMYDFGERDLLMFAEQAEFAEIHMDLQVDIKLMPKADWNTFLKTAGNPLIPTIEEAINSALTPAEARQFCDYLRPLVENGHGVSRYAVVYLWAIKR